MSACGQVVVQEVIIHYYRQLSQSVLHILENINKL